MVAAVVAGEAVAFGPGRAWRFHCCHAWVTVSHSGRGPPYSMVVSGWISTQEWSSSVNSYRPEAPSRRAVPTGPRGLLPVTGGSSSPACLGIRHDSLTPGGVSGLAGWLRVLRDQQAGARVAARDGAPVVVYTLPRKYSTFIGYEQDAAVCRTYEPLVVPGLLQTEEYARATIRKTMPDATPEDIEARVQVRMRRQEVLTKDRPLRLRTVISELVLRQQVGTPEIMHAQYQRLIEAAGMTNVSLQVHTFNGPLACVTGPFVMIEFRDRADKGAIYLENAAGDLYLEKPHQLERYTIVFEELCADALGADDTVEFVEKLDRQIVKGARDG